MSSKLVAPAPVVKCQHRLILPDIHVHRIPKESSAFWEFVYVGETYLLAFVFIH